MKNLSWEMIGAISGFLSFVLAVILGWDKIKSAGIKRIFCAFLLALLIGIIVFFVVISIPIVIDFSNPTKVYDNFGNPAYDGSFNPDLWLYEEQTGGCNIYQERGEMVFNVVAPSQTYAGCRLNVRQPSQMFVVKKLEIIEARIKISSDHTGNFVNQAIGFVTNDLQGDLWWALCGLNAGPKGVEYLFEIRNWGAGKDRDIFETATAKYDNWYTFRVEVNPDEMIFSCFVDNNLLYSIIPSDASDLEYARFHRQLSAYRDPDSSATSFVDDVRISP